eukprot:7390917-Prymnesium_polylepis.3
MEPEVRKAVPLPARAVVPLTDRPSTRAVSGRALCVVAIMRGARTGRHIAKVTSCRPFTGCSRLGRLARAASPVSIEQLIAHTSAVAGATQRALGTGATHLPQLNCSRPACAAVWTRSMPHEQCEGVPARGARETTARSQMGAPTSRRIE